MEKGDSAGWPEEAAGTQSYEVEQVSGHGGAAAQEMLKGMLGAVLWECSVEEACCDQEGVTRVWNIKKATMSEHPYLLLTISVLPGSENCGVELPGPLLIES